MASFPHSNFFINSTTFFLFPEIIPPLPCITPSHPYPLLGVGNVHDSNALGSSDLPKAFISRPDIGNLVLLGVCGFFMFKAPSFLSVRRERLLLEVMARVIIGGLLLSILGALPVTLFVFGGGVEGRQFTLVNKCSYVVWPAIQPDAGHVAIARGGMCLPSQTAQTIETPAGWSGRIWGRRDCTFDENGKHGYCSTGDCGGALFCNGAGVAPPATIVEITLSANSSAPDLYDVSLVQGYNLAVIISPSEGGSGKCRVAGCTNDVNVVCPHPLQMVEKGSVVACNSACLVFNSPKYCCTGRFGELITCRSNTLSELFKNACPLAYSYTSDKAGSLVTNSLLKTSESP